MTLAVDSSPEDESGSKALSPADATGRNAFLPEPEAATQGAAKPRPATSRLLDYGAHAAMIVGLVGFAWTVSNHVVNRPAAVPVAPAVQAAAIQPAPAKVDEVAELRQANKQMSDDIRHLRSNLDALRSAVHDDKTPTQMRVLQAGLENVQNGLTAARNEAAQLSSKFDKVEQPRLAQLDGRIGRLEKSAADVTTGSIAAAPAKVVAPTRSVAPTPPEKPQSAKVASLDDARKAADEPAKLQVLPGFVVRDVYEGVAYIESRRGPMEVVPGVSIPGAGVVKSIDRQGKGWTVTTTKGVLAYAAPPRPVRRADYRGFYPGYPGDY